VALDVATAAALWRTKPKCSGVVTVSVLGRRALAATGGEVFCLEVYPGRILWQNKLKGLGLGLVTLPGTDAVAAAAVQGAQRNAAAG
jgi:hypothetical protein